MNETIVLSPEAFEKLKQELMKTGPIQIGHGSIQTFLGFPIVISKNVPPGQVFMVQDPAGLPRSASIEMTVTLPQIPIAQARMLLPYCEVSLWDEASRFCYAVSLRQGDCELGMLSVRYEDAMISRRLPGSLRRALTSGRIDKDELSKFLQGVSRASEWWEAVEVS